MLADTIVAVSTPRGAAVRGVVRVSGPRAREIVEGIFYPVTGGPRVGTAGRGVTRGTLILGRSLVEAPCALWVFRGPASYTGEDVVEIHLAGAPNLLEIVQELLVRGGARPATAGEFTRRAFENGRMDLTSAEAVAALIGARDQEERNAALALLEGGLERRVAVLRDRILDALVPIEVGLDFSDQDVEAALPADLDASMEQVGKELERLASSAVERAPRSVFRTVLSGPANAGKSSLFNRLLGREEALVTPVAGTTRDYLTGETTVGAFRIQLVDTAGSGGDHGAAGAASQALRRRMLREADLVLEVRDGREPSAAAGESDGACLRVLTHGDLLGDGPVADGGANVVSNVTGAGLDRLREALENLLRSSAGKANSAPVTVNQRHGSAFREAGARIQGAREAFTGDYGLELVASDLHNALKALARVTGDRDSEVLDRIFAGFCIGK